MRFAISFYGVEARVLGMMHRRNRIYISVLKDIAKKMGGRVPTKYRALVKQHASDAADTAITNTTRYN